VTYKVVFRDDARKTFDRLDRAIRQQVGRAIDRLAENPRPGQATQLVGDPTNVANPGR
jgi:mRNA-degrading endonuclease RelE of RelBE toxin-antitoxin system